MLMHVLITRVNEYSITIIIDDFFLNFSTSEVNLNVSKGDNRIDIFNFKISILFTILS